MKNLSNFKYTLYSLQLGLGLYLIIVISNTDIINRFFIYLSSFEKYQLIGILIAGFIVFIGLVIDFTRKKIESEYRLKIRLQRLHVFKSTVRTMQEIINNLILALQYYRICADDSEKIDEEFLEVIDSLIDTTTDKLHTLSNLESTDEKEIYSGLTVIDYNIDQKSPQFN